LTQGRPATGRRQPGATRVRLLYDGNDSCVVMQDIEGSEFRLG
jgi:hypothetical protein